jgi:hypothetical protein
MDYCLLHLTCFKRACKLARGRMLPKHHLWYHLTALLPNALVATSDVHLHVSFDLFGVSVASVCG